jgi:SAM-dependent methyltransferase
MNEELRANLANWNERVPIHLKSSEYNIKEFVQNSSHIGKVVDFDRTEVGDVSGKTLLHLQCHIGTDTLSWARLGADVTGVDFSELAIEAARQLSKDSGTPGRFIVSELYESPSVISEQFDIVYTGVGAICWLPDIGTWAKIVEGFMKPGGLFYIRDGHSMMWGLAWETPESSFKVIYPYFEAGGSIKEDEESSYAGEGTLENKTTYGYNHGLGETIDALLKAGLIIEFVHEHTFCEWQGIKQLVKGQDGRWRLPPDKKYLVPLMFSIRARKPR